MSLWDQHRAFFEKQVRIWSTFMPETTAEIASATKNLKEAQHGLLVTMRCEHGRARELWDAIADMQKLPKEQWNMTKMMALYDERDRLIGIK